MAKAKVTRKWLNESYPCISVGYCGLDNLLNYEQADYYTCGTYGWNCDAYKLEVDGQRICITTGYRGMIDNAGYNSSYELYTEYNDRAEKMLHDNELAYDIKRKCIKDILNEYLREVIK